MRFEAWIIQNKYIYPLVKPFRPLWLHWVRVKQIWRDNYRYQVRFYAVSLLRKCHLMKPDAVIAGVQDRYKGMNKRGFVIATGPSLRMSDLDWLNEQHEITISMNGIFKVFDDTQWRPDYYLTGDPGLLKLYRANGGKVKLGAMSRQEAFTTTWVKKEIEYDKSEGKVGFFEVNFLDHWINWQYSKQFKFTYDLKNKGLYDVYVSSIAAALLLRYMGIEKIYFLGQDCDYSGEKKYIKDDKSIFIDADRAAVSNERMQAAFKHFKEYADQIGMKVYNATRGGKLEVFQRVDMDDIIAGRS